MPADADALEKLVRHLADEFQQERQLTAKLAREIKLELGAGLPRKIFEREVLPLIEAAKKMEDARVEIKSQEQTIKRLERQIDILQKDLASLKKDALTEADIRPFKKLIK